MTRLPTNGELTPRGEEEEEGTVDGEAKKPHDPIPTPALWQRVSKLYSAIVLVIAIAMGGGGLYVYFTSAAPQSEVRAVDRRVDNHEARIQMLETATTEDKHDRRIMQLQLFELARTSGARVVPGLATSSPDGGPP